MLTVTGQAVALTSKQIKSDKKFNKWQRIPRYSFTSTRHCFFEQKFEDTWWPALTSWRARKRPMKRVPPIIRIFWGSVVVAAEAVTTARRTLLCLSLVMPMSTPEREACHIFQFRRVSDLRETTKHCDGIWTSEHCSAYCAFRLLERRSLARNAMKPKR